MPLMLTRCAGMSLRCFILTREIGPAGRTLPSLGAPKQGAGFLQALWRPDTRRQVTFTASPPPGAPACCRSSSRWPPAHGGRRADLAGLGPGSDVDELDLAGSHIGRDPFLDEGLQFLDQFRRADEAVLEYHEGLDPLTLLRVGHADDRGLEHRLVLVQGVLHLSRGDAITPALDDVVDAGHVPEQAVLVLVGVVTGEAPAVERPAFL